MIRIRRLAAITATAVMPLTMAMAPAHGNAVAVFAPPVPKQRLVKVHPIKPNKVHVPAMHPWYAPAPRWSKARLKVTAGRGAAARGAAAVTVSMLAHRKATAAGLAGVLFTMTPSTPDDAGHRVHVSLDYSSFGYADGGDFASRLRLVELPACALTTPQRPACRIQTPLATTDDDRTTTLGADVTLPAKAAAHVVMAATTTPSGSAGDFSATPLSEAGNWVAGTSSGAFTYSYPITVPPVPGGLEPSISLDYNSQAVDGLTSSTNSQASWIGDGWNYSPGFVERTYQSCETEPPGATNWVKSGDLCWSSNDSLTLSLNGQDTTIVQDATTGAWHAESDENEKISYLTGTSNGTHDGGYWVVTDPDGTSYYFGLNELPGYAAGDTTTNSAWTVPVFATSSGQQCYSASFASSSCPQAWRWNLDYVTDPNSNAVAYFYKTETNNYAADNGTTATASYTQAGALSAIEYGLRAGAVYGATPAGKVAFNAPETRTDVPTDLACASKAACDVVSPTFWGKFQLTTISTQALEGAALAPVDSWTLSQSYPSTGDPTTPASLWLSSIQRTGQDTGSGGASTTIPQVSFVGKPLANRVMTPADNNSGYSIISRFRMATITTETGGVIGIAYDTPGGACTSGNFPAPDANTGLCYPDYWTPPGASGPILDWFNKYVVTGVTQENTVGGGVTVPTSYAYSGAAWHYNDDSLTRSSQRTWDQWRGFRTVTTQTGTAPDPVTEATDTYFQGMNGDFQSGGTTSSVSLTSTHGDVVTDSDQFAGMNFEDIVYDGTGGSQVSDAVSIPWSSAATATQAQPSPLPALKAFLTGTAETKTFTPLAAGGSREADVTYTHDSLGRVTAESDVPEAASGGSAGDASETTCTTTTYASSTSANILDLPKEIQVVSVPCGTTPVLPADAVSDTLTYYDGATSLASDTPSKGNLTMTQLATSYSGSVPTYSTQSTATYDEYGRVLTSADADGHVTTTSYTPATGASPTAITVTDPAGLVTTTSYDPARELPTLIVNPANYKTSEAYDGLGRLTAVWLPGHMQGTAAADYKFGYSVSDSVPSIVTTSSLNNSGGYTIAETLYDSLGRVAETQSATPDGNRDITDQYYNSDGQVSLVSNTYASSGAPNAIIVGAPDSQVPSQTGSVYDGDGRIIRQVAYKLATETSETDTAYSGNATTVTYKNLVTGQPTGGIPQTTLTNGFGLTSQIYQYHSGAPVSPTDAAADYDRTGYTYTPAGQLATITDAGGNNWAYAYDLNGNQTSATSPDAGKSTATYDPAGQLMTATDARGKTISYTYDADGRKIAEYDTTGGAAQTAADEVASWTYDTKAKGMLTSSSTFYGGQAYTQSVLGYGTSEQPTGTETIIPAAQGALAGTYQTGDSYDPDTGLLSSYADTAAGGLPGETVTIGRDTAGNPVSLSSPLWTYVSTLSYSELAQPVQYKLGPTTGAQVTLTDSYDQETGLLTGSQVVTNGNGVTVDQAGYTYDNVGDVLSESDTPASGAQVQCFKYDYLGRLSQAWSQGSSGCANAPSTSVEGGAAPYWDQYSYDVTGDLTSQKSTQPSGAATTTTSTYPAPGASQPNAITTSAVSGGGTTRYAYDAAGHLTGIAGPSLLESLSWDDAGRLASMSLTPAGGTAATTTYLYNADGSLLLQADPSGTTLYLGDEQLVSSGGKVTGTRFYSIGGVTIAARSSAAGDVYDMFGDREGTSLVTVDASAAQTVTRRYFDPYGNPLGAASSFWPGDKGFVGGTADAATGLTNLGLREYNPATASFISPDPLISAYDPQDLNSYAYSADDPSTNSDPTGAMFCSGNGYCGGGFGWTGGSPGSGHGHATVSAGPAPRPAPAPAPAPATAPRPACPFQICGRAPRPSRPAPRPVTKPVQSAASSPKPLNLYKLLNTAAGWREMQTAEAEFNKCMAQGPSCPSYNADEQISDSDPGETCGVDVHGEQECTDGSDSAGNGDSFWGELLGAGLEFVTDFFAEACDAATDGVCLGASPAFWQLANFGAHLGDDLRSVAREGG